MTQIAFLRPASPAILGLALLLGGEAQAAIVGASATRTSNHQIAVTWTVVNGSSVDVLASTDPAAPPSAMQIVSIRDYDGEHFAPAQKSRLYFLIQDSGGDRRKVAERTVPLSGGTNFRDVGGYQTADGRDVRWGMIYRSSELVNLTAEDYEVLNRLGIRAVYDLRSTEERKDRPIVWQGAPVPEMLADDYAAETSRFAAAFRDRASAGNAKAAMTSAYQRMIDDHRVQFRAVFAELLEDGNGAVLYHGGAGSHRAGVQTALILAALGVPRDAILADYELSNTYLKPEMLAVGRSSPPAMPPQGAAAIIGADRAYLQAFFDAVDSRYGGVDGYLSELGVGAAERQALRARYTE